MKVLVINAGSSSLKYQFIDIETEAVLAKGLCERIGIEGSMLTQKVEGKDNLVRQENMKDHSDAINMVIEALTTPTISSALQPLERSFIGIAIPWVTGPYASAFASL